MVLCRRCGLEFLAAEDEVGSCPVCGGARTLKLVKSDEEKKSDFPVDIEGSRV